MRALSTQLQQISKQVANACKAVGNREPAAAGELEQALKLAKQMDWPELVECLHEATSAAQKRFDEEIASRRENLLRAAKDAGVPTELRAKSDRIGIFTVDYEGALALISLGGLRVETRKESDGRKLFEAVQKCRSALDSVKFQRDQFFQELKTAMEHCRRLGVGGDGFIPLRDLHRELVLDRTRRSDRFRRAPEPKNMEPYPLYQFMFDLARFGQRGWLSGSEKLATQAPSMREGKDTVFLVNLEHPLAQETAVARLAIKPV